MKNDTGTRGQGDAETRGRGDTAMPGTTMAILPRVTVSPFLRVSASPLLRVLLLALFILYPSSFILAAPRATVRVRAESTAHADRLILGDIAEVQTTDSELVNQLRLIPLGYAPQVGAVRELTRERISLAISAAGFSPPIIEIEAPPIIIVRREAQTVDPTLVRRAVEQALVGTLHSSGATVSLTRLDLPASIEVPTGSLELRASVAAVKTLFSPFSVALEFWVDGKLFKRLSATAQAEVFAPVLVAARDLGLGARLREGDFKIEVKPLLMSQALYFSEPTRLRGTSLVRSISRGEAITTDAIVAAIVVKPGDPVRIMATSGALSIFAMGEARAAGHVGDRIQVKNLQSGMLFQAVVVDEGMVSVRF